MTTLADTLLAELDRARDLKRQHEAEGVSGETAAAFINLTIRQTERAMVHGDTADMLRCIQALKGLE